jgi:sugar/nucleoside kinase (ribokinase family)
MPGEPEFAGRSLCVVGNINRDIKTSPIRAGEHLFRDGETSVASIVETIGGGGANSCFAAAALGARCAFLGKVGADAIGDRLFRTLTHHGIRAGLARSAAHPSGASIALTFDNGHRHFVSSLPANESLAFDDLELGALNGFDHLLRADIWFSRQMLFEGNKPLLQHAQSAGLATSVDLNWDPQWGRADADAISQRKQAVRAVLPWVDLAHGNIRELQEFADASTLDLALGRIGDWGAKAIVVHMGSQGAGHYRAGKLTQCPAAPTTQRVHAAGAGDVLSVCMMLLHGSKMPIESQLRLSNSIVAQFMQGQRDLIPPLSD